MKPVLSVHNLHSLAENQFLALKMLRVSEHQEILGKSFLESIEEWAAEPKECVLGLCFLLEDHPIGLAIFRRQPQLQDQWISIHGLKIAIPWQGRGYGHEAFRLAIQQVRSEWPEARCLRLAVDAENTPAIAVYRGFGMSDSGPVFDGPNGKEHQMELPLRT